MKHTTVLSTVSHWKFSEMYDVFTETRSSHICINLWLGEVTIHWVHSSESTAQFECLCKSFLLLVGLFPLATAFENCYCCWFREWFILHLSFSFLALVDKTIHFPVFLVASIIFGFSI